ncbi:adult-specific cuticular protein ACP-22-like [Ceratina calcarata]|uniref:Adult-specific cuticular protein ACP-22-like n=1 Tax=Ceratina calcarata TaxID=156304 RepID=A0AAJ7S1U7_9HYME|nr:adult-specific cuticular protein ACP-22-like [Ceratina calcarata]
MFHGSTSERNFMGLAPSVKARRGGLGLTSEIHTACNWRIRLCLRGTCPCASRYKSLENPVESGSSHLASLNTVMRDMRTKIGIALTIALLAVGRRCRAGVISLGEGFHGQQDPLQQHGSLASSYLQFHGPVEGPVFEVKVPHEDEPNHLHGQPGYTVDYVAQPKYQFSYGVEDHETGDFHSQKEIRDGSTVSGQYSVKEPGGSVRVVSYRADKDGFHAVVHTSGKNDHDVYAGQGQQLRVHDHQPAQQDEHDYEGY